MTVPKSTQTRVVGIITYMGHPYACTKLRSSLLFSSHTPLLLNFNIGNFVLSETVVFYSHDSLTDHIRYFCHYGTVANFTLLANNNINEVFIWIDLIFFITDTLYLLPILFYLS